MNTTFFAMKRAHQSSLRFSRAILARVITPARFDMLYAIHLYGHEHGMLQRELRDALGVTPPVISRMLKALVDLGYVCSEVDEDDCRRRIISLREKGRELLRQLIPQVYGTGIDTLALASAIDPHGWWDPQSVRETQHNLETTLGHVRDQFRDVSKLDYSTPMPSLRAPRWAVSAPPRTGPLASSDSDAGSVSSTSPEAPPSEPSFNRYDFDVDELEDCDEEPLDDTDPELQWRAL